MRAGIERRVLPHSLRHTLWMRVVERSGHVLATPREMRLRSIVSTTSYVRPDPSVVGAANAMV